MDNRYVDGSSTPISERDADGNTYQRRRLADGSDNRVLKNFPTEASYEPNWHRMRAIFRIARSTTIGWSSTPQNRGHEGCRRHP